MWATCMIQDCQKPAAPHLRAALLHLSAQTPSYSPSYAQTIPLPSMACSMHGMHMVLTYMLRYSAHWSAHSSMLSNRMDNFQHTDLAGAYTTH